MTIDTEVIVIGAGLAGLAAARTFAQAGKECILLEKKDRAGGSVFSENCEGITIDHGFNTINTWFPAIKELLHSDEYSTLRLQQLWSAVRVARNPSSHTAYGDSAYTLVGDPIRVPQLMKGLHNPAIRALVQPQDVIRLFRWLGKDLRNRSSLELRRKSPKDSLVQRTMREDLTAHKFSAPFRDQVLIPVAEMLLGDALQGSAAYGRWALASFIRGSAALPAHGMGDFSHIMARIPGVHTRFNTEVLSVDADENKVSLRLRNHGGMESRLSAQAVVLAVDPLEEETLLGTRPCPRSRTTTWWYHSDRSLTDIPVLTVEKLPSGVVVHAAEVTSIAPSYAPGRTLLQVSTSLPPGFQEDTELNFMTDEWAENYVRTCYGAPRGEAEVDLLKRQDLSRGIRHIPAEIPLIRTQAELIVHGRVVRAGANVATPSLDGLLRSGQRAAKVIIDLLA